MTSTSSEMAMLAESMVSDVSIEDGYRVANPSEAEVEGLRALLNNSIHEVHHFRARNNQQEERQA